MYTMYSVHGQVLAHPWVALEALAVLVGEAVAGDRGVALAVSILVELADGGNSDFLVCNCLRFL